MTSEKWFHGVTTPEISFKGNMSGISQKGGEVPLMKNVTHVTSIITPDTFFFFFGVLYFALLLFSPLLLCLCWFIFARSVKAWHWSCDWMLTVGTWQKIAFHPVPVMKLSTVYQSRVKVTSIMFLAYTKLLSKQRRFGMLFMQTTLSECIFSLHI